MWCTHYVVPGVRIPHFPQSVEFGKPNKMQKGMEVIDFHFFVGNSACWEFIIIKVLWFTKRKGAYTLTFVFCLVVRTVALHRMPPAGIRVFEVGGITARCPRIPHSPRSGSSLSKAASQSLTFRKRCKSMVYGVYFIKSGKNRVKLKFIYPFSFFYKLLKYSVL